MTVATAPANLRFSSADIARDDTQIARATVSAVNRRLMPFLFLLYIFNFLDRSNVGFAALQMNRDLGLQRRARSASAPASSSSATRCSRCRATCCSCGLARGVGSRAS